MEVSDDLTTTAEGTTMTNGASAVEEQPFDDTIMGEEKGKTFRKRRLSVPNLRRLDHGGDDDDDEEVNDDEKAHTFRKRRLSLPSSPTSPNQQEEGGTHHHNNTNKRQRTASDTSCSDSPTSNKLQSKTLHAPEILSPSPTNKNHKLLPKFYQTTAAPVLNNSNSNNTSCNTPRWKTRHHHPSDGERADEKNLPFQRDVVGTFSCHGVEPIYDDEDDDDDDNYGYDDEAKPPTMAAKTNQDRGGIAFPYGNSNRTALFAVYDGHGQGGELVSQYSLHEIQRLLEKHPSFHSNIETAFKDTFLKVDASLTDEGLIEPMYAGTTACVALLRDTQLVLSNAGDSRAVLGRKHPNKKWEAIDLTVDQNPDLPSEQRRIESMGGYVTPAPEPGLSSRVWLDKECSQIGLAMARSIGDHAVKSVGVIAEPVVSFHTLQAEDEFLVLATDGVWEFVSSKEAVAIIAQHLHKGATKACQVLIETAAAKWHDEEGDYRDDITALVIRLPALFDKK